MNLWSNMEHIYYKKIFLKNYIFYNLMLIILRLSFKHLRRVLIFKIHPELLGCLKLLVDRRGVPIEPPPVNHTNRMDVACCHLIDRPQSVPQRSYNRTLQFSKRKD